MNILKLAEIYKRSTHDAATIAEICDTIIDRSGGLLGEVRKAARKSSLEEIDGLLLCSECENQLNVDTYSKVFGFYKVFPCVHCDGVVNELREKRNGKM